MPFLNVLKISLAEQVIAQPPYSPLFYFSESGDWHFKVSLDNYRDLFNDDLYIAAFLNSTRIAFISAVICLLIGYPMAYGIMRTTPSWRNPLLMLVALPFWTSFLLRVYAWIGILNNTGILNNALLACGFIDRPLVIMKTEVAIYIGIVYSYLPFVVLPVYSTLEKMDTTLLEAAADLGARPFAAFLKITLPLSWPGILAGFSLVFIPALGEFVIPDLLGGSDTLMLGHVLWDEFFANRAWPIASAVAIVMLLMVLGLLVLQNKVNRPPPQA